VKRSQETAGVEQRAWDIGHRPEGIAYGISYSTGQAQINTD